MIRDSGARFVKSARFSDRSADIGQVGLVPDVLARDLDLRRLLVDPGLSAESAERLSSPGSVISWSADRIRNRILPSF